MVARFCWRISNYLVGLVLQGSAVEWRWKLDLSATRRSLFVVLFGIPRTRWLTQSRIASPISF